MILEELTLRNFGLYRGTQTLDLKPGNSGSHKRPIVLCGGLNGGGKTTLLDAVLLALYGRRAECSKKNGRNYDAFLLDSINYAVSHEEGAGISLKFRYFRDGKEETYEVRRAWHANGKGVREDLDVLRDGVSERYLADRWKQLVEDLVPTGLSQLFFFDAEQIRRLAEDDTSFASLGGAVKSLLGLDLVESLIADAVVLSRRQIRSALPEKEEKEIEAVEEELRVVEEALSEKRTLLASERNTLLRSKELLRRAEHEFAKRGGDLYRKREELLRRQSDLRAEESALLLRLNELAAKQLPLVLIEDLLRGVHVSHKQQIAARQTALILKALRAHDRKILDALRKSKIPAPTLNRLVKKIEQWAQEEDRKHKKAQPTDAGPLDLSERSVLRLNDLFDGGMKKLRSETREILEKLQSIISELEDLDRLLSTAPKESDLAEVNQRLLEENRNHATATERVLRLETDVETLTRKRDTFQARRARLLQEKIRLQNRNEEAVRVAHLADRTAKTMREFLRRSASRKIEKLSNSITEAFQFLLRKQSLVNRIQIDPETFAVELSGPDGKQFPKQRLSEGEKQLFAIAVLWGLARTSGRPLPAIIDTPMARLDSDHRGHLVERYFPHASHQVIILSTDTEVDREYYRRLKPHVARSYALEYNEKEKFTQVKQGYFWE